MTFKLLETSFLKKILINLLEACLEVLRAVLTWEATKIVWRKEIVLNFRRFDVIYNTFIYQKNNENILIFNGSIQYN